MKVLWLSWKDITHPDSGGAEMSGLEHAKAWTQAGHSVHWVSTGYTNSKQQEVVDGIVYEHIGSKWMWYLGVIHILMAYKYITQWKNEYDFIVDEIHGPPLLTPLYAKKPKIVIIHEVAGDIWKKTVPFPISWIAQHIVEPFFFKAYTKVPFIVGAQTTKDDLIKVGISEQNITLIPYGVTIPIQKTNYPKEVTPTLIFLSSLRPIKGFDRVYEAFKSIQKEIPEIKLWVVGDDSLPYGQKLKQKVLRENKNVIFNGKVSQEEKFELLQRAHILTHGSYKEGWGLVVIESNAVGTPAVVFDAAGLRNSIISDKTGYLARSEREFCGYIVELLNNTEKYTKMQQDAKVWSKQFSWGNSTAQSLQIISKMLNSK